MSNNSNFLPYKSYIVFKNCCDLTEANKNTISKKISNVLDNCFKLPVKKISQEKNKYEDIIVYKEIIKAKIHKPWVQGDALDKYIIEDYFLLIICFFENWTFISVSDNNISNSLHTFFSGTNTLRDQDYNYLSKKITLADAHYIQGVLPKGSVINTFWLSGIHKQTEQKPDSKIMTGLNLEKVLDPYLDQSYHFTSARFRESKELNSQKAGISPSKSRVWFKRSKDWSDFVLTANELAIKLDNPSEKKELRILSHPTNQFDDLGDIADILFQTEYLTAEGIDSGANFIENLFVDFEQVYNVKPKNWDLKIKDWNKKYYIKLNLLYDDEIIGSCVLQIGFENGKQPLLKIKDLELPAERKFEEQIKSILKVANIKIWFDSSHTLSKQMIYYNGYRDVSFDFSKKAIYVDFDDYSINAEKPMKDKKYLSDEIGNMKSLFCWLKNNNIPEKKFNPNEGLLICDDGAGEISDFIYLNDGHLILFHLKAAKKTSNSRRISTSAFEVVCGQAIKNIRYSDFNNINNQILSKNNKNRKFWFNGEEIDKTSAIGEFSAQEITEKSIIILQPHLMEGHIKTKGKRDYSQVLLEALLAEVDRTCKAVDVNFSIVGAKNGVSEKKTAKKKTKKMRAKKLPKIRKKTRNK